MSNPFDSPTPPPGGASWQPSWPPQAAPTGQPYTGGPVPPPGFSPYGGNPLGTREHPNGTAVLVLGILSLVLCQLLGPIAWIMGSKARREMKAESHVTWSNSGTITAGWVCGIVATGFIIAGIAALVLLFAVGSSIDGG